MSSDRDLAGRILDVAAWRLGSSRPEWANAMRGELASISSSRLARTSFALGCLRVALAPPITHPRRAAVSRTLALLMVAGVLALALLVQSRALHARATGQHGWLYESAGSLVGVLVIALEWRTADRSFRDADATASRYWGIGAGLALGGACVFAWLPILGAGVRTGLSVAVVPLALLLGIVATVSSDPAAERGRSAGWLIGVVAGILASVVVLAVTWFGRGWIAHDPSTVAAYRDSVSVAHHGSYHTHFASVTGFVDSENLDTALIGGIAMLPLFCGLGGLLGRGFRAQRLAARR